MAGMKGITVNTAQEAEPHIYAEDDAAIFQSIFGEDGVSSIGQACKATVLSNNKVRIADGVVFVGGHFARIPYGEYVDCEIANGQSGKNRNDIIVAKFVTTGSGGIDTMTCEVKQGTAGTTAADPALTQNDIYTGGKIREFPLYRVKIEGLNITAVEQLFTVVPTNEELIKTVAELNGKMENQKREWTKLCEIAGNQNSSKTFTVEDLSGYSEILLTCGPAVIHQTGRILGSTTIPIKLWNACNTDYSNGYFQSTYGSNTYVAGVTRLSDTSVKLYANSSTLAGLYVR